MMLRKRKQYRRSLEARRPCWHLPQPQSPNWGTTERAGQNSHHLSRLDFPEAQEQGSMQYVVTRMHRSGRLEIRAPDPNLINWLCDLEKSLQPS